MRVVDPANAGDSHNRWLNFWGARHQRYLPGQMQNYIEAPLELFNQDEVDLVLVDGRERIACALASAKILKPGGLLMIHDFWGRSRYRAKLPLLLEKFEYLFESPHRKGEDPMGMAVFRCRG